MSKIEFRGEEMSLEDAIKYLSDLKSGRIKINLTEQEKRDYARFEEATRETNEKAERKGLFRYFHEKEYLIGTLGSLIVIQEHLDRIKNN